MDLWFWIFGLVTFVWDLWFSNFCFGSLVLNFCFGSLVWELLFGIFGLGTFVLDLWFWIFGVGLCDSGPGDRVGRFGFGSLGLDSAIPGRATAPAASRFVCVSVYLLLMLNENPKK